MNKNEIAILGCGKCGSSLLDSLLDIDSAFNYSFINTNMFELENLNYFSSNSTLHINTVGGLDSDRKKGKIVIKEFVPKIANFIDLKFPISSGINIFYILCSSSGGTGSSLATILPKIIRMVNEDAIVNIVSTIPQLDEGEISINNTIDFWNDFIDLFDKGYVNNIQFIDNSKMKNEYEFNNNVMQEFYNSITASGTVDTEDVKGVNICKGYKATLSLNAKYRNIREAVDKAIKDSNFILPSEFECERAIGLFDENNYNLNDVQSIFSPYQKAKYDYNYDNITMFTLGGCNFPKEIIEELKLVLEDYSESRTKRNNRFKNLKIETNNNIENKEIKQSTNNTRTNKRRKRITSKDINDLYDSL